MATVRSRGARRVCAVIVGTIIASSSGPSRPGAMSPPKTAEPAAQADKVAAGVAVFVLNRALDKSGLLDKIGLGNPNASKDQIEELKRSVEGVTHTLAEIQDQITSSTENITNQIQELREFTAFQTAHAAVNSHVTVFSTVREHYTSFLEGPDTTLAENSVLYRDIRNVILAKTTQRDFAGRVDAIHSLIIPIVKSGEQSEGVLGLVAKVARANGRPFSTVENYFLQLASWQTLAMGMYLDAMRYDSMPAADIENARTGFLAKLRLQRKAFLEAAEAYALFGGPLSTTSAEVALAPLRRADLLQGKKPGSSFDLTSLARARVCARGQPRNRMRTSATVDLKAEKLELTITNPGNEGTPPSPVARR